MPNSARTDQPFSLAVHAVSLDVPAESRWEALEHIGNSLELAGAAHAGYRDSLQARERRASTYLGHGVAVPHALHIHDYLVTSPGLSVTRFARPVPWEEERVSLCIAVATPAAGHVELLCRISALLLHPTHLDVLNESTDPAEITRVLQAV